MSIQITPSGQSCGAEIRGLDISQPLSSEQLTEVRQAWLEHHVLSFPDQHLDEDQLEQFKLQFGPFGDDPFIAPIPGRKHIIAVQRAANETAPVFAEAWHTDWSFQVHPPIGTCLYGVTIPPTGGDTLFINQHRVWQDMPDELKQKAENVRAIHSAKLAYHPEGQYGKEDAGRSMDIRPDESAAQTQAHPLIRNHSESGEAAVYGCAGYIIGIEGMEQAAAEQLLMELYLWQTQPQFQYRHQWQPNMLVMWDNRSVLHMATGGYDGHARYLLRTTIGATA
ncbi:MAG: TauD/TfdA family dioxygenase [Gammaproteobacteria bacterium]|nr:TauD/TfdA family dioxygenase [Gammaproteobacteria bacterium]